MNNIVILWYSKKQKIILTSIIGAKYVFLSQIAKKTV